VKDCRSLLYCLFNLNPGVADTGWCVRWITYFNFQTEFKMIAVRRDCLVTAMTGW